MSYSNSTTTKKPTVEAHWHGSLKTALLIKSQIAERWGEDEAENYNPETNCFTFQTWKLKGYRVKKGEKALRSYTIVEKPGSEEGEEAVKYPKGVCLFYYLQVEKGEGK